jgi:hypothetical protein
MGTLKAGLGGPARTVFTVAVTVLQLLVFASVMPGPRWDGLVTESIYYDMTRNWKIGSGRAGRELELSHG